MNSTKSTDSAGFGARRSSACPGPRSHRSFFRWTRNALAAGGLALALLPAQAQFGPPQVIETDPPEGGQFQGTLLISFSLPMEDTIAITFSEGEWDAHWKVLAPGFPNFQLECVPIGDLPPGATITYTLNPDGRGFSSTFGDPLPTTTGTFVVPDGGGGDELEVTPPPADEGYCPDDGPVRFLFNQPMKPTWSAHITPGDWEYDWQNNPESETPVFACTPVDDLIPGQTYTWVLNPAGTGFESADGKVLPVTTGTFFVGDDCGGGGGGENPACPNEPVNLPLPKTLSLCGEFGAWSEASAVGLDDGYLVFGSSVELGDEMDTAARLDAQGLTQWLVAAVDPVTDLIPVNAPNQLLATRNDMVLDQLDIGLFDATTQTPLFRKQLSPAAEWTEAFQREDGQIIVLQTFNDHLELILLSATGELAWARRYDSPDFVVGDGGGFPGTEDQSQCHLEMLPDGMALVFSKTETQIEGGNVQFTETVVLTRLSNDGAVLAARKFVFPGGYDAPALLSEDDGSFLLSFLEPDTSDPEAFSLNTRLVKLDAAWDVVWVRLFTGVSLHPTRILSSDRILAIGFIPDPGVESTHSDALLAILDATGQPVAQARLDAADTDFAFVARVTDRIYVSLAASTTTQIGLAGAGLQTPDFSQTIYVGSTDLQLSHFQWKKYHERVTFGGLFPTKDTGPLLFSAFTQDTHQLDVFTVNEDLTPNTTCPVWADGAPTEKTIDLASTTPSLTPSTAEVTTTSVTPTFSESDLTLRACTWIEEPFCGGEQPPTPTTLSIQADTDGVTLSFPTVTGQSYTLQKSAAIQPAEWQDLETVTGTGEPVSRSYPAEGQAAFFRVLTTRN